MSSDLMDGIAAKAIFNAAKRLAGFDFWIPVLCR